MTGLKNRYSSAEWDRRFAGLTAFKKARGHSNVPRLWPENPELARWAQWVRNNLASLSVDQLRKIYDIGFAPALFGDWLPRFLELAEFKEKHGHCRVPDDWKENRSLGRWVTRQRRKFRLGKLLSECKRLLDQLDFEWKPGQSHLVERWRKYYEELKAFKRRFAHCRVRRGWQENGPLANWVLKQRGEFRLRKIWPERKRLLDQLGFEWNVRAESWKKRYEELKTFKRRFGHCCVPQGRQENKALASWVLKQRGKFCLRKIWPERRRLLDQLGFEWKVHAESWRKRYEELKAFKRRFGHCRVPEKWKENRPLGSWVVMQRWEFRRRRFSPERKRLLDQLGFDWDPMARRWSAFR